MTIFLRPAIHLNYMDAQIKKIVQQLTDLQDKTQHLDDLLKDVRVKINDIIWDFVELRKSKEGAKGK